MMPPELPDDAEMAVIGDALKEYGLDGWADVFAGLVRAERNRREEELRVALMLMSYNEMRADLGRDFLAREPRDREYWQSDLMDHVRSWLESDGAKVPGLSVSFVDPYGSGRSVNLQFGVDHPGGTAQIARIFRDTDVAGMGPGSLATVFEEMQDELAKGFGLRRADEPGAVPA